MKPYELVKELFDGKTVGYQPERCHVIYKNGALHFLNGERISWNQFFAWSNLDWYVIKTLKIKDLKVGDRFKFGGSLVENPPIYTIVLFNNITYLMSEEYTIVKPSEIDNTREVIKV